MNQLNKAGLILILALFMFDLIMIIAGIKEGKETQIIIFNFVLFVLGSGMFGVD